MLIKKKGGVLYVIDVATKHDHVLFIEIKNIRKENGVVIEVIQIVIIGVIIWGAILKGKGVVQDHHLETIR